MNEAFQNLLSKADLLIVFIGMAVIVWGQTSALRQALSENTQLSQMLAKLFAGVPVSLPAPVLPGPVAQPAPPASKVVVAQPPVPVLKPSPQTFPPKPLTEYDKMWAAMQIDPKHQAAIDRDVDKVLQFKAHYEEVATQSGVPWFVIGIIDIMEAGGGCDAHLHNGDPLKGRTIHVPAGRPPAPLEPPFTWQQSALDALKYEGFSANDNWSLAGSASKFEHYNGMGYHLKGVPSPYLWSFSNQYVSGKFIADHVYDANEVSQQAGAMTILKGLIGRDPSIKV